MKIIGQGEVESDGPIPRLFEAAMDLCIGAEAAIRSSGNCKPNLQLVIPVYMGDDLLVTIERGPETAAKVAIFKAKIERDDE